MGIIIQDVDLLWLSFCVTEKSSATKESQLLFGSLPGRGDMRLGLCFYLSQFGMRLRCVSFWLTGGDTDPDPEPDPGRGVISYLRFAADVSDTLNASVSALILPIFCLTKGDILVVSFKKMYVEIIAHE